MRWAVVLVVALVGCGGEAPKPPEAPKMSFLEAEAIWKDEVAKLEAMTRESDNRRDEFAHAKAFGQNPDEAERNAYIERSEAQIIEQHAKVNAARAAKERAKPH